MKKFLILITVLLSMNAFAAIEEDIEYYNSGELKCKETIVTDNSVYKQLLCFYKTGKLKLKAEYKDGEQHGFYIEYLEDGSVEYEVTSVNGKFKFSYYYGTNIIIYKQIRADGLCEEHYIYKPSYKTERYYLGLANDKHCS